jgi:TonB family protein
MREEQQGRTTFRVIVGRDGRVTYCEIRESSGWPALDQATCSIVTRRARFSPATDRRGEPIEASYSSAVRWQIPDDSVHLEIGQTGRTFVVEADGAMADCRDWGVAQAAPGYAAQCNGAEFFVSYRDKQGKLARRQVTITTETSVTDAE